MKYSHYNVLYILSQGLRTLYVVYLYIIYRLSFSLIYPSASLVASLWRNVSDLCSYLIIHA